MDGTWTINELAERAAAALAADGSGQVSGRVRDLPNERLIRWYTTIGLVDPPLGRRGRIAQYGPRHLLQLVAVKRRQAAGRSIAEIQLELAAATDAALERIAALPFPAPIHTHEDGTAVDEVSPVEGAVPVDEVSPVERARPVERTATTEAASPPGTGSETARATFWRTRPDVSYGAVTITDDYGRPDDHRRVDHAGSDGLVGSDDCGEPRPSVVQGVRLTSGLTLLLDVPALSGDDLTAIETAARPLLDELRRRGLLAPAASPAFQPADPSRRSQ
ncbi:MerR family transcriptional regulator [Spirillospora sp. NPDC048823]|uniref:helix-turn-helix domain-containing protein n=1 Tax=unclassified Spirillospora TaxID=2642701 RepID=UPI00371D5829